MSHRVVDPLTHSHIPAEVLEVGTAVDGYEPVRAPGGAWFFREVWTGQECAWESLPHEVQGSFEAQAPEDLEDDLLEGVRVVDPEVQALQEASVHDPNALKAIFVLGAGGAGKSMIARNMFSGLGLRFINQDKHLERLMKDAGESLSKVGQRYDLFKAAQQLSKKELKQFTQHRNGVVVDMTGWAYNRVSERVMRLKALGYDCYLIVAAVSLETALRRNKERERKVPDSYIKTAHYGLWKNFPKYKSLFGSQNVLLVDTNTDIPQDVMKTKVGPALRSLALEILARPLKNKKGKAWLQQQREIAQMEERQPVRMVIPDTLQQVLEPEMSLEEGLKDPYILKAVFIAGGSGSGKSFTAAHMFKGLGLKVINSDDQFEKAMKDAGMDMKTMLGSKEADALRDKAKVTTRNMKMGAVRGRLGMVIDGTGKKPGKLLNMKKRLEAMGYDTAMVLVSVPLEVAIEQNAKRERVVPDEIVKKAWNQVQAAKGKYEAAFKPDFIHVENKGMRSSEDIAKVFGPSIRGKALHLLNKPLKNPRGWRWLLWKSSHLEDVKAVTHLGKVGRDKAKKLAQGA